MHIRCISHFVHIERYIFDIRDDILSYYFYRHICIYQMSICLFVINGTDIYRSCVLNSGRSSPFVAEYFLQALRIVAASMPFGRSRYIASKKLIACYYTRELSGSPTETRGRRFSLPFLLPPPLLFAVGHGRPTREAAAGGVAFSPTCPPPFLSLSVPTAICSAPVCSCNSPLSYGREIIAPARFPVSYPASFISATPVYPLYNCLPCR